MASDDAAKADRVAAAFSQLAARRDALASCADLHAALSAHFQALTQTLSDRSLSLQAQAQSFDAEAQQAQSALQARLDALPAREACEADRVLRLKASALEDVTGPEPADSAPPADSLRSRFRRMDAAGVVRVLLAKKREPTLRADIAAAVGEAVDPLRVALDAAEEFIEVKRGKGALAERRWACGVLMQAVFPDPEEGGKGIAGKAAERAAEVLGRWKEVMEECGGGGGEGEGGVGPGEAIMFLQMVCGFGIREKVDAEFLRKLVVEHAARKEMPKISAALGFKDKMKGWDLSPGIISDMGP